LQNITKPYFYTWSEQDTAPCFPLDKTLEYSFISNGHEIDELSAISFQCSFGLKNKIIEGYIKDQLDNFGVCSAKADYQLKTDVTNKLLSLLKLESGKIFYTVSGAESVENALKVARIFTNKNKVAARFKSYHGATRGALEVTGDWRNRAANVEQKNIVRLPDFQDDMDASESIKIIENNKNELAAIILETIPAANGVYVPTKEYLQALQSACKSNGILFILDEVVCGFYRTIEPFGYQNFNLKPDIVCMAKGISGGFIPFGAVYFNEKISNYFNQNILPCGLTNYAHPLGLITLKAILELTSTKSFQNQLHNNKITLENFIKSLHHEKNVDETRVIGLLSAIETKKYIPWDNFFKNNLSIVSIKDGNKGRIILSPFLTAPEDVLKKSLDKLLKNIREIDE
tara:strand:+ start:21454 stop:22656 length:1203 start_codon:yes stop_codon:yes gene_type:complete